MTVFEQPPGSNSNTEIISSSLDNSGGSPGVRSADDFQLSATTLITDIHWWRESNAGGDAFTFTFYANSSGAPGAELLTTTGSLSKAAVSVGSGFDPVTVYSSDLATPFPALGGTTYWVSVFNGASDASWLWLVANDAGNGGALAVDTGPLLWFTTEINFSFQLTSTVQSQRR